MPFPPPPPCYCFPIFPQVLPMPTPTPQGSPGTRGGNPFRLPYYLALERGAKQPHPCSTIPRTFPCFPSLRFPPSASQTGRCPRRSSFVILHLLNSLPCVPRFAHVSYQPSLPWSRDRAPIFLPKGTQGTVPRISHQPTYPRKIPYSE